MLKWSAKELSDKSALSVPTIQRIESGADAMGSTINAIEKTLEKSGVAFIPADDHGGVGVRLKK